MRCPASQMGIVRAHQRRPSNWRPEMVLALQRLRMGFDLCCGVHGIQMEQGIKVQRE